MFSSRRILTPPLLPFHVPVHAARLALLLRSMSDKHRRSLRRSFRWPGTQAERPPKCGFLVRGVYRRDGLYLKQSTSRSWFCSRWFVPLISRWIDRLVRHHPVQFRCAPDGVLLTLDTPSDLFRL